MGLPSVAAAVRIEEKLTMNGRSGSPAASKAEASSIGLQKMSPPGLCFGPGDAPMFLPERKIGACREGVGHG